MNIGLFGTGMVGKILGTKMVQLGHKVKMGSRTAGNQKAIDWASANGQRASHGTYAEAAASGEIIFNCTNGNGSLEALFSAGEKNLNGKILIDVANPLDFSKGMPPSMTVCNTDSLGEQIQKAFPQAKVVKTLNTLSCNLMVNPKLISGDSDLFICGNDAMAKLEVTKILRDWFEWKSIIDLGDITNSRGTEMLLPLWVRLMASLGTANFNFKIIR